MEVNQKFLPKKRMNFPSLWKKSSSAGKNWPVFGLGNRTKKLKHTVKVKSRARSKSYDFLFLLFLYFFYRYHRMQKREKIKQQMKEFEMMQKTDPAAALEKLKELEKSRAEERATLRHRNTGKWAQSLAVRAKYDKEVISFQ